MDDHVAFNEGQDLIGRIPDICIQMLVIRRPKFEKVLILSERSRAAKRRCAYHIYTVTSYAAKSGSGEREVLEVTAPAPTSSRLDILK